MSNKIKSRYRFLTIVFYNKKEISLSHTYKHIYKKYYIYATVFFFALLNVKLYILKFSIKRNALYPRAQIIGTVTLDDHFQARRFRFKEYLCSTATR